MPELVSRCAQDSSTGIRTLAETTLKVSVTGSLEDATRKILFERVNDDGSSRQSNLRAVARVLNHGIKCSNGVVIVVDKLLV